MAGASLFKISWRLQSYIGISMNEGPFFIFGGKHPKLPRGTPLDVEVLLTMNRDN